jgi:hypothetical protein
MFYRQYSVFLREYGKERKGKSKSNKDSEPPYELNLPTGANGQQKNRGTRQLRSFCKTGYLLRVLDNLSGTCFHLDVLLIIETTLQGFFDSLRYKLSVRRWWTQKISEIRVLDRFPMLFIRILGFRRLYPTQLPLASYTSGCSPCRAMVTKDNSYASGGTWV